MVWILLFISFLGLVGYFYTHYYIFKTLKSEPKKYHILKYSDFYGYLVRLQCKYLDIKPFLKNHNLIVVASFVSVLAFFLPLFLLLVA
ncbi:putative membrane protein [Campylobacter geochelonis]|nr:putative membrane protein [Campylobacter geochelonis]